MANRTNASGRLLLPFGLDYLEILAQGQATEKPELKLPVHGPLSGHEIAVVKQLIAFQRLMFDGPFYTGSPDSHAKQAAAPPIERFLDKYKKKKKVGRLIDEYPYQLSMFPEELYPVLGISHKKKKLLLSTFQDDGGMANFGEATASAQLLLEHLTSLAEEVEEPEEEEEEEDVDDEFEEEDDDDYNAEKYFDGGDDDVGDEGDDEAAF